MRFRAYLALAGCVATSKHALAYDLGDFLHTMAPPQPVKDCSLTSLREKRIKIAAKIVGHGALPRFE